ncbi:response regulator [Paenibacillus sp. GCM10023252]|uniref:response regulator n=1 Tax=Paenibacillus sp. GCM10023252 TaxID=3252649 RepID=UPI00360E43E6
MIGFVILSATALFAAAAFLYYNHRKQHQDNRNDLSLSRYTVTTQDRSHTRSPERIPNDSSLGERRKRSAGEAPVILVVDDQASIRVLLLELFKEEGCTVYEASHGQAALAQFHKQPIDCILLDLKMPDMDGIEVLRSVRETDPNVMVVMISAYGDLAKVDEARRLGVATFFTKPFDIEELRDYVMEQLHYSS